MEQKTYDPFINMSAGAAPVSCIGDVTTACPALFVPNNFINTLDSVPACATFPVLTITMYSTEKNIYYRETLVDIL